MFAFFRNFWVHIKWSLNFSHNTLQYLKKMLWQPLRSYRDQFLLTGFCISGGAFIRFKHGFYWWQKHLVRVQGGLGKSEVYSEHSRTSKMKLFAKSFQLLTIFAKKLYLRRMTGFWIRLCKNQQGKDVSVRKLFLKN